MCDTTALRVADLTQNRPNPFEFRPDPAFARALAAQLGLDGLRKLRLAGVIAAQGQSDWRLQARLGATVVQACVVTLAPVTTRIDIDVTRIYIADWQEPETPEVEMRADDNIEALGSTIDPAIVLSEALALALPQYPRADGADLGEAVFTEPGKQPMRDEDAKPFAGLSGLRATLKDDPGDQV